MTPLIQSLRLRNFKCFRDEEIPLGRITLLTGLNGGGKSSAIQGLLALRQSHLHGMLDANGSELALNGDYVRLGTGADVLCASGDDAEGIGIGLTWTDGIRGDWSFEYRREGEVLAPLGPAKPMKGLFARSPFAPAHERRHLSALATDYVSADRLTPRSAFAMSDYRVGVRGVGPKGELTAHFLADFGEQKIPVAALATSEGFDNHTLLRQVEAWLRVISPGVVLDVEPYRTLDAVKLRYAFESQYGRTADYRPSNVGFGLTYCLPVLTALLAASPGSLVVLENPEAHLHPRGQFEFARLMCRAAEAGVQVVVETHSDHVLNGLRVAVHQREIAAEHTVVHFFERSSSDGIARVTTPAIDSRGRFDQWPPSFFDQWENALDLLMDD